MVEIRGKCAMRGARLSAVFLLLACQVDAFAADSSAPPQAVPSDAAMADYRAKLEDFTRARQKYDEVAGTYWNSIAEKRRARNEKRANHQDIVLKDYVLTQPPVYSGPPEPVSPIPKRPPPRKYIPVVADFLKAATGEFGFKPQTPRREIEFKLAYAKAASAAGLTKDQAVRVYAFEAGGNGHYDVQAGLENPGPNAHAISTALGYNQLLNTNSVELLSEHGENFVKALTAKAATLSGPRKAALKRKIDILRRMTAVSKSVPDEWSEHEKLANTPQGLGIHALNLDIDVGPLLQTHKLLDSVEFARRKKYTAPLTAAELEMMNLTGDGNGFDMVTMPANFRSQVPTANFFQPNGYAANPVAITNNTVAKLVQATDTLMDREVKLPGAKELAAAF
jgi:hypothetical protein